ncbi:MAG: Asp-tRNA(Asn)/Glu-tRNA(Gln) amidotransferase subunit GatB [Thermoleophilia bacterium]|nr:Asp-tRNA(Asn)/Glu-tRNA(Gln) amidotransferase subunit GatB [Thermoleophilia bacterium]
MSARAYEAVIGIEIHAQLLTNTKMFCGCALSFGDEPNVHTCPVCLAHPGALPVTNAEAVRLAIIAGHALGCEIPERSTFHRKNYFYPDLPKAYQISQFDEPICGPGRFRYLTEGGEKELGITRAHLEEDAAKLIHVGGDGRRAGAEQSIVDFNRGGTPLLEIVTEPELSDAADAAAFLRQLRLTLVQLGITDGNMEQGSMRADANISIRPAGSTGLGTKTELKNMNSFTFIERGIQAEIARQTAILEAGGTITQETLHYDPVTGEIHSLRSKEEAHDYRYFPEPDLVSVAPDRAWVEELRASLPESPVDRRRRWVADSGLSFEDAEVLAETRELGDYFERVAAVAPAKSAANWVRGELRAQLRERGQEPWESNVTPAALGEIIAMAEAREVSMPNAKAVLAELIANGGDPRAIVEAKGLGAISDEGELEALVDRLIADNPAQVQQLRDGKDKVIGFFVGQAMKATQGRADPGRVGELLRERVRE